MKKTITFLSTRAAMILLATLLLTLTAQTAWADDPITGGCGTNVTYTIEGNTLTISGTGAMYDYTLERDQPWHYYNNITNLIIKEGVTHIGKNAFSTVSSLISVSFEHGSQLTSIGDDAFYNCYNIQSIKIPATVTSIGATAFQKCTGLTSVTIPISVTSIGASAFNHCDNLEFLSIGSGVTTISDGAFSSCGRLTTIVINAATPPTLGSNVFDNNVENRNIYMLNDYVTQYQNAWTSYANDIKAFPIIIQDDNCGENVKWNLVGCEYNYVLTISGTGAMDDYYSYDDQPWGNYRGDITTVFIKDGVTSIGDYAFSGCAMTTLVIPNNVESIGDHAFHSCDDLATLSLGSGVTTIGDYAFAGCALTSLEIPNNVKTIGDNAFGSCEDLVYATIPNNDGNASNVFEGCSNLTTLTITGSGTISDSNPIKGSLCEVITTLTIGDGIEGIGESAFYGCNKLATLSLGSGVTSIGDYAFSGCAMTTLEIPNNVKTIGDNAFEGCNKLVTLSLGSGVTTIGDYAFHSCDDLATLSIGSGVTTIGQYAFAGCALTSLEIPNNVKTIGYNAFASCEDLASATIPNNDGNASKVFEGCSKLTTLTISGSGTISGLNPVEGSLSGVITTLTIGDGIKDIDNSAFEGCNKLATLSLGSGVTTIGDYAFKGCALTTLVIPDNVESIGDHAFEDCNNLATLSLGSGVTTIGDYAFHSCDDLATLSLGSGVTTIGDHAFAGCALTSLEIPNNVKTIGDNAFGSCKDLASAIIPNNDDNASYVFEGCSKLTTLTITGSGTISDSNPIKGSLCEVITTLNIGDGIEGIGESAFYGCNKLATLSLGSGVTTIGDYAFSGCAMTTLVIPNNVESIGDYAFNSCDDLATLSLGSGVTTIGNYAFNSCANLATLSLGSGVTTIGNYAFSGCAMTSLEIPDNVETIGDNAFGSCEDLASATIPNNDGNASNVFEGCSKLTTLTITGSGTIYDSNPVKGSLSGVITTLTIGDGIKDIDNSAFEGCNKLATLSLGSGVTSIGDYAFSGCAMTTLVIPNNVESIGDHAFEDCNNLATLSLGSGVTSIGEYAFNSCDDLATLSLGSGVTSIGDYAFSGCALTTLVIPDNVETIGDHAFEDCDNLATLFLGSGVTTIGGYAFKGCAMTTLTIPASVTTIGESAFEGCNSLDEVYCFADPFTTWEGNGTDFKTDPNDSNNKTKFYVTDASAWTTAWPNANVEYVEVTPVSYIDENGMEQTRMNYTVLRTDNPENLNFDNLPSGWYVVENWNTDNNVNSGADFSYNGIHFKGDTHLILCDGAEMSVNSGMLWSEGILTIYGQSGGSGAINIDNDGTGITVSKDLTINGGIISVSTSSYAIYSPDNVVINGGRVTASAQSGGAIFGVDGVVINGGKVTATAQNAAIDGKTIAINGGTVIADGPVGTVTIAEQMIDCTLGTNKRAITENIDGDVATALQTLFGNASVDASFSRTFKKDVASTVCLPFPMASIPSGKVYQFVGVTYDDIDGWVATMSDATPDGNKVTSTTANTPYLFKPNLNVPVHFTGTINPASITAGSTPSTDTYWTFNGTYSRLTYSDNLNGQHIFGFAASTTAEDKDKGQDAVTAGEFVKAIDGAYFPAFRAYLAYTGNEESLKKARGTRGSEAGIPETITVRLIGKNGEIDGIGEIRLSTGEVTFDPNAWYDLNGRKLAEKPTQKGIYINNGHKIAIK